MAEAKRKPGRPKKQKAQELPPEPIIEYRCQKCGAAVITPAEKIYTGRNRKGIYRVLCRKCIARFHGQLVPYVSYNGLESLREEGQI